MKIPDKLKILAHTYSVDIDVELLISTPCMGSCCPNLLKIKIADGIPESNQADTLVHEILEALNYQLELGMEHNVISSLSASLLAVIRDNDLDLRARIR